MKAILFHHHGGPEVLEYADFATPQPGPNDVLIRLEAAALNRLDLWVRQGWPGIRLKYPHIPGADGAGIIASLGENITEWALGDRVVINSNMGCGQCKACLAGFDNRCRTWHLLGETIPGTFAQYVVVPAHQILAMPPEMDMQTAAAASLIYHTAWHSLVTLGKLKAEETVLVVGATGGVNTASIQIAKWIGAQVYVIGSNAEKLKLAEELGADILVDRSINENWAKIIYTLTEKRGVDVVVDNVGTTFPMSLRAAGKGGRILTVGNTGGPIFEIDNRFIFAKHLTIIGSTMGTKQDFIDVMALVFSGALKVAIDRSYPLSRARAAQERLASGQQLGKITLDIT
ncbi:MAG: zinc-binding dehydrogenase [Anaerolineae bacterium]|nr:zinc-binding dehydrogenase [Anaerolineae bacterium]